MFCERYVCMDKSLPSRTKSQFQIQQGILICFKFISTITEMMLTRTLPDITPVTRSSALHARIQKVLSF